MAAAKNLYLCYDLDRHRAVARTFLEELKANRPDARIVAASRREEIAATQRPAVMAERMRGVDIAIVLKEARCCKNSRHRSSNSGHQQFDQILRKTLSFIKLKKI